MWFLLLLSMLPPCCLAGCADLQLCCDGRNLQCKTQGWRPDLSYGTCYCDLHCVTALDCCHDYQLACPAVDCDVSEWGVWSRCAEPCWASVRLRSRHVLRGRRNSGRPCPHLQESAGCAQYQGKQGECFTSMLPALITSGSFGSARKKRDASSAAESRGYCVEFQVVSLSAACWRAAGPQTGWTRYLREGHRVCVVCQPPALAEGHRHCSGDGEEAEKQSIHSLQWQALGNTRCSGLWRRIRRLDSCTCPEVYTFLFI